MDFCLVFTPDDPQIYNLNPSAWLILQLCDGKSEADIVDGYHAAVEPLLTRDEALCEVQVGISSLVQMKIVEVVHTQRRKRIRFETDKRGISS
jgi:Coenzyme PQQ synthesis protein D (PqqD)